MDHPQTDTQHGVSHYSHYPCTVVSAVHSSPPAGDAVDEPHNRRVLPDVEQGNVDGSVISYQSFGPIKFAVVSTLEAYPVSSEQHEKNMPDEVHPVPGIYPPGSQPKTCKMQAPQGYSHQDSRPLGYNAVSTASDVVFTGANWNQPLNHEKTPNVTLLGRLCTGRKLFKCNVCGKIFNHMGHFRIHERTHTGEKPFECDTCGKKFTSSSSLHMHKRTHMAGERHFKCDVCDKTFIQAGQLKAHKRVHSGEKPYTCDVCGQRFSQFSNLTGHIRTHTGERPFNCDVCGKTFTSQRNLVVHNRVHTQEKPYKCDVCDKRFAQSSALTVHKRIHSGDKRFQCEYCDMACHQMCDLRKHMRKHTGEKPFKCDVCGKAFSRKDHCTVHRRIIHS